MRARILEHLEGKCDFLIRGMVQMVIRGEALPHHF
jgi:hypothetical protein